MIEVKDQTGKQVRLEEIPTRIICLVPSITELLCDLDLQEQVVGITKFCVHPAEWFQAKPRVGGTKNVSIEKIMALIPDLVIANKEENVKQQVEAIEAICPVYTSDISNLHQALEMIEQLGQLTGKTSKAGEITQRIRAQFAGLWPISPSIKTCYLIWQNPLITIGGDTFISHMLAYCGFENITAIELRYPEITLEQLVDAGCRLLLLSSEPFPFKERHIATLRNQLKALAGEKQAESITIKLVDGEMFSWYGSRMLAATAYFAKLQTSVRGSY